MTPDQELIYDLNAVSIALWRVENGTLEGLRKVCGFLEKYPYAQEILYQRRAEHILPLLRFFDELSCCFSISLSPENRPGHTVDSVAR